ncbi:MAG: rRNA maturation RNase YbeY [Pontiellaceae bacterium]|jgi:rRNA maturation RNase YbeY|nr:rRNA maturation RNase YbeY [Pontiellaceae bacterium]
MNTLKTCVKNNQKTVRVNLPALRRLTAGIFLELEAADPETVWQEVTLLLTDDKGITQYNRRFFGKDYPADVISFRSEPVPGEEGVTGDLIVNVECAVREGPRHDGIDAELALYIAHGFDHLSGAEDNTPARRAAMHRTEARWLAALPPESKKLIRSAHE